MSWLTYNTADLNTHQNNTTIPPFLGEEFFSSLLLGHSAMVGLVGAQTLVDNRAGHSGAALCGLQGGGDHAWPHAYARP